MIEDARPRFLGSQRGRRFERSSGNISILPLEAIRLLYEIFLHRIDIFEDTEAYIDRNGTPCIREAPREPPRLRLIVIVSR